VKGQFVGGSDIMLEMFESGELKELVGQNAE
jgi:monothiol glutaredoxin